MYVCMWVGVGASSQPQVWLLTAVPCSLRQGLSMAMSAMESPVTTGAQSHAVEPDFKKNYLLKKK